MNCLRCGFPMYQVVGPAGNLATCTGCSQYVACAVCSSPKCADTKCLKCYNKSLTGPKPKPSAPIVPDEQEL